ncbi:MAG: D-2-hydroxyacid dehydrogenase [Methylococcales bacterium]|jgi:glycerate dehydrogenase|nr:D-2-hydroxyacid dehydrogenase [Methylococcales bacterium]MBT7444680.1 D-2-hydroxyacid dehydrogenase [Methylococcales bacterium]
MKMLFLDVDSVHPEDLDLSKLTALGCEYFANSPTDLLYRRIADAQTIITNKVILDEAAFNAAPLLKHVCIAATGLNNIDLNAAKQRGIQVDNVTHYCTESVVQHVFSLILALNTRLQEYSQDIKAGIWSASNQFCQLDHSITEISGKTLGIIGFGALGQGVAKVAKAFGMNILIAEKLDGTQAPDRTPLKTLLQSADIVTLHCPLTPESQCLLDAEKLSWLKPSALLINTARGAIIDNQALATTLRKKHIRGAGIDVLDQEPPPLEHPLLAQDLTNLILTPHTAWASQTARQNVIDQIVTQLRLFKVPNNI